MLHKCNYIVFLATLFANCVFAEDNGFFSVAGEGVNGNWVSSVSGGLASKLRGRWDSYVKLSALAAQVENPENSEESVHYGTVDASIGIQYGRRLFFFTEVGVDAGEIWALLTFNDAENDLVDPDRHFAYGLGFTQRGYSLGLFQKYRYVSGYFAGEQEYWFTGIEFKWNP